MLFQLFDMCMLKPTPYVLLGLKKNLTDQYYMLDFI